MYSYRGQYLRLETLPHGCVTKSSSAVLVGGARSESIRTHRRGPREGQREREIWGLCRGQVNYIRRYFLVAIVLVFMFSPYHHHHHHLLLIAANE